MTTVFTDNMTSFKTRFEITVKGASGVELDYVAQELFMALLDMGYDVRQDFSKKTEGYQTIEIGKKGGRRWLRK